MTINQDNKNPNRIRNLSLGFSALILIGFAAFALRHNNAQKTMAEIDTDCNNRTSSLIGGPFNLIDQNNKPFTQANLNGSPSIIYFGYSWCPDICPNTLNLLGVTLNELEAQNKPLRESIKPIFISLDPARDTPAKLKEYLSTESFPKNMIGLTGSLEDVKTAAKNYKVAFRINENSGESKEFYTIDHQSIIYLMDKNGKLATFFTDTDTPQKIAKCINSGILK